MRTWLLADQSLLLHQASNLEATDLGAFVLEHGNDTGVLPHFHGRFEKG